MKISSLLIANRGEIAIRIAGAAAELGIRTVAVYAEDDVASLHVRRADKAVALTGSGARAYLDIAQLVAVARAEDCDAVHPGYGFLGESAAFARACRDAGVIFVGPSPETLDLFGDKLAARDLARRSGVPVPRACDTVDEARDFFPGGAMVKAVAGGGGRGMRAVFDAAELSAAYERCRSEAMASFGSDAVYIEALVPDARHIEVQIIGDAAGDIAALGERDCSLQRRQQKIVEIAPAPNLAQATRVALTEAALTMARTSTCVGLATFEFLVHPAGAFFYIETNPRLQVEHTVTEEVTGIDLVRAQLRIAGGETLAQIGIAASMPTRGVAIELRINMETIGPDGAIVPSGGTIAAYEPPSGPGIRVDGYGYGGYRPGPSYDSLLAKLIVHAPTHDDTLRRARRALDAFRIDGVATNIGLLAALLDRPEFARYDITTRFIDDHVAALATPVAASRDESGAVAAPMTGLVVAIDVEAGDLVRAGQPVAVLESMKMEHVVAAPFAGVVRLVAAVKGEVLAAGQPILHLEPRELGENDAAHEAPPDLDAIRPDLAEVMARHELTTDAARGDAVAKRHAKGGRTARANVEDLCDPGSFIEYGALTSAAQRSRRSMDELLRNTPTDGVITGLGTINAARFGPERAAAAIVAYDYTVLAGTQGTMNHKKQDRLFRLCHELRRPVVMFAEGGGGRPGDTDKLLVHVSGGDLPTWSLFGALSGLVPLIGIVHGRCFAGNAALLGCCDVIIATESASIGMAGPAMIEGGGLGVFEPDEIGPISVQAPNGVVDLVVRDEAGAVAAAKKYLGYFQGALPDAPCADQRLLRGAIPENRLRVYDIRAVIATLADTDSVMELRPSFGIGIVTALVRIGGKPFGIIANNPVHLGGAIDAAASDKAARFIQLCDAHDLPIVSLCDTPGFMVGPEAEKEALVRRACRMFVNGATASVPYFTVVLRKGYGLGAMAMAAGNYHASTFTVSWPTGEFGGMGLEGAVRLAYRRELAAIADPDAREAEFRRLVAESYERGKAISTASVLEIDDVIDPAATRDWILRGLNSMAKRPPRAGKKRTQIEPW